MASKPIIILIDSRSGFLRTFRNNKVVQTTSSTSSSSGSGGSHYKLRSLSNRLLPLCSPFKRQSDSLSSMATPQATADSSQPSSSSTKTERVVIKGRVQGVFYRNWTVENATLLGLKGWVRNRRDGSVEALFSGTTEAVQEMEQRWRRGPSSAVVTGFEVFPSNENPSVDGFERRQTV